MPTRTAPASLLLLLAVSAALAADPPVKSTRAGRSGTKPEPTAADLELAKPAPQLAFDAVALGDVMTALRGHCKTTFFLDQAGLKSAGVEPDAPVTVAKGDKATVKSVLTAALADVAKGTQAKLAFATAGNVVLISTAERARAMAAAHRRDVDRGISDADRAILARVVPGIAFDRVRLADVLDFLPTLTGSPVEPDWGQLKAAGLTEDQTVTATAREITVAQLLRLIIDDAAPKQPVEFFTSRGRTRISRRAALRDELNETDQAARARAQLATPK